jgi:hypothetical protein
VKAIIGQMKAEEMKMLPKEIRVVNNWILANMFKK